MKCSLSRFSICEWVRDGIRDTTFETNLLTQIDSILLLYSSVETPEEELIHWRGRRKTMISPCQMLPFSGQHQVDVAAPFRHSGRRAPMSEYLSATVVSLELRQTLTRPFGHSPLLKQP